MKPDPQALPREEWPEPRVLEEAPSPLSYQMSSLSYTFPTALPMQQTQEITGSGGTLLPQSQTHTKVLQTICVGQKLVSKQLGSLHPFHYP